MIKTQYKTITSVIIVIGMWFFIILLLACIYSYVINSQFDFLNYKHNYSHYSYKFTQEIQICLSLLGVIVFMIIVSSAMKILFIDPLSRSISIRNSITMKPTQYSFSDFDGFYDLAIDHSGKMKNYTKAVGLVKEGKILIVIDSYYCSNLSEIRDSIKGLKYLGTNSNWEKQNF